MAGALHALRTGYNPPPPSPRPDGERAPPICLLSSLSRVATSSSSKPLVAPKSPRTA
jgi:hypothetical protein